MGQDSPLEKIQLLDHALLTWTNGKEENNKKKGSEKQVNDFCGKVEKYGKV